MSNITMKEMLVAGMHFGHQTRRWNPKMKPYIFGARNKIYIINLDKTLPLFNEAYDFITDTVAAGGTIMFVGTKRQAQETIKAEANRCGMHFVNHRWLGGMLTNYQTIKKSVDRMKKIQGMTDDGSINRYKKKEALMMTKQLVKLDRNLGGIKDMKVLPAAMFVIDPKREKIAIDEARRLGIPVVAITDTNCDPDGIDYLIPGNDDAIKSITLITAKMADAAMAGRARRGEAVETTDADLATAMADANTETTEAPAKEA